MQSACITDQRRPAKDALFGAFASVGRALSSGRRTGLIELLSQGERTVEELARDYLGDRSDLDLIDHDELRRRLGHDDVVIVDVRPEAEYAAGHLPGAVHVPPDQFDRLDDLPADRDVIAHCRGPYCVYPDDAVRHPRARGRHAARFEQGLPEWSHAGGTVEP